MLRASFITFQQPVWISTARNVVTKWMSLDPVSISLHSNWLVGLDEWQEQDWFLGQLLQLISSSHDFYGVENWVLRPFCHLQHRPVLQSTTYDYFIDIIDMIMGSGPFVAAQNISYYSYIEKRMLKTSSSGITLSTLPYCKWQEARRGPGNEATKCSTLQLLRRSSVMESPIQWLFVKRRGSKNWPCDESPKFDRLSSY